MSRRGPKGYPPQVTWCRSTRHRSSLVSGITSRIEEKLEGTIVKKCSWSDLAEGTSQYEPMVHAHATKWDEPAPRAKPVKRSRESAWDEEDEQQVRSKKPSSSRDDVAPAVQESGRSKTQRPLPPVTESQELFFPLSDDDNEDQEKMKDIHYVQWARGDAHHCTPKSKTQRTAWHTEGTRFRKQVFSRNCSSSLLRY